jgi:solute carrier family 6 amino acid transporter-like protein 5/7/9/14
VDEDIQITTQQKDSRIEQRGQWNNQWEFLLSAIGYAVGLGNVWRFPYLAYTNGGGSFLVPYVIMLFFAGLPLFFMELAIGQYSGLGPAKLFGRMAPIFKGLGFSMVSVTFFVSIYYNMIIGWTLFYMVAGFTTSELPWASCSNSSSVHCQMGNITEEDKIRDVYVVGPEEDYYNTALLGLDKSIHNWHEVGEFRWQLIVSLFSAWAIVCLCLIKGVQSSGKVVYFTCKISIHLR